MGDGYGSPVWVNIHLVPFTGFRSFQAGGQAEIVEKEEIQ
jgi:hypothetical protein